MQTIMIDGKVYKLIRVPEDLVTNQDYFESAFHQMVQHYKNLLDRDEMKQFCENVINF
jgi:hypothetical protein